MSTVYVKEGERIYPSSDLAISASPTLEPITYTIKFSSNRGYYLIPSPNMELPSKLYGDTDLVSDRIINTFKSRKIATGALFVGEKGSGKTLVSKVISKKTRDEGFPTILITDPWYGSDFNSFMQLITQPVVLIIDEFEKVYTSEDRTQDKLLTLLDGVASTKRLYLLTCNEKFKVNSHMTNRPGRIFYYLEYFGITPEFIDEFCKSNLDNKDKVVNIQKIAKLFTQFNFDMLSSLVEEINRYPNDSVFDLIKLLNVKPELDKYATYTASVFKNGVELQLYYGRDITEPLTSPFEVNYIVETVLPPKKKVDNDDDDDNGEDDDSYVQKNAKGERVRISHNRLQLDISHINKVEDGRLFFTKDGIDVILSRKKSAVMDLSKIL